MDSRIISTMGSTRISATKGFEDNAKDNYSYIRALANHAASKFKITMDAIIGFMTSERDPRIGGAMVGLRSGSFNSYCRTGVVSEFTVNKLYHFFDEKISVDIFNGRKLLCEDATSIKLIFSIMMDKLYKSTITSINLDGIAKDIGGWVYYSLNDYVKVLINDIKEDVFSFPDDKEFDLSEIDETEKEIEEVIEKNVTAEEFNSWLVHNGLEPDIHENEKFISLVSYETLDSFDLPILIKCREDHRTISEMFDAVIKFKEAKLRPTQTI